MKNIAAMFGVFFLGILVVACVMTSSGRSNREMELADNLPAARDRYNRATLHAPVFFPTM